MCEKNAEDPLMILFINHFLLDIKDWNENWTYLTFPQTWQYYQRSEMSLKMMKMDPD